MKRLFLAVLLGYCSLSYSYVDPKIPGYQTTDFDQLDPVLKQYLIGLLQQAQASYQQPPQQLALPTQQAYMQQQPQQRAQDPNKQAKQSNDEAVRMFNQLMVGMICQFALTLITGNPAQLQGVFTTALSALAQRKALNPTFYDLSEETDQALEAQV